MACPSFADIGKNEQNPTCNDTTIGATSGTTSLEAQWTANTINLDWDPKNGGSHGSSTCSYDGGITLQSTPTAPTGYEFAGWKVKQYTDLMTLIGASEAGEDRGYISNDGEHMYNTDTYGITHNGEFVVDYGNKGKIHGYARCSARSVENYDTLESDHFTETLPDSSGDNCYCQLDGYVSNGGSAVSLSGPWVFENLYDDDEDCAENCGMLACTNALLNAHPDFLAFRAAIFGVTH
jgi:hypothetical protein